MGRSFGKRLIHEVPVHVPDGGGGRDEVWEVRGAIWCEVRMRSGSLRDSEFGQAPRLAVRIVTPVVAQDHAARPWPGHRLVDGIRRFEVEAVQEDGAGIATMTILAREQARSGGAA